MDEWGCVLNLFALQAQGDKVLSFALPIFDSFLLVVFLVFLFFFLPKVVFEGSLRGFYGAGFLVAVDNVVFLRDECRERPSRCESPERIKTRHCSQ